MTTARKTPLWQALYDWIGREGLEPGDRLPAERELATRFQTSRNSMREALRQLQALGLVEIRHGSGIYRAHSQLGGLMWPLKDHLANKRLMVEEVVETRLVLELAILRLAIQRASPAAFNTLEDYLSDTPPDDDPVTGPDFYFEEMLADIAGNRVLGMMQKLVHQVWADLTRVGWRYRDREDSRREHREIFRHMRQRDTAAAESAMVEHLRWAVDRYNDMLAETEP